jgi:hypothetical protein
MKRIAVLFTAGLFAMPLLGQEQIYLYVSYQDAKGMSLRHKLDCLDVACTLEINASQRRLQLSAEQRQQLLSALQAESQQFRVAIDPPVSDRLIKVKLRYDAPMKRLEIERRLPADQPADLTSEMLQAIKTHLEIDLAQPLLPTSSSNKASGVEAVPQDKVP